jgi:magnesium transporter
VRLRDWFRVCYRELGMGVALGLFLGTFGYMRALMWHSPQLVALVVGMTLVAVVVVGSMVGATLPLLFKLCRVDPGVASSPFVASLVDVVGIVIYFTVARTLMPIGPP